MRDARGALPATPKGADDGIRIYPDCWPAIWQALGGAYLHTRVCAIQALRTRCGILMMMMMMMIQISQCAAKGTQEDNVGDDDYDDDNGGHTYNKSDDNSKLVLAYTERYYGIREASEPES